MSAERQTVHQMRLCGASRSAVMAMVPEIEDALATTSWPGQSGGASRARVLQIRKLDLQRLRPGTGRFAIARLIEAQIAKGTVGYATAQNAQPDTDWVVWPDRVEMLVALVLSQVPVSAPLPWWGQTVLGPRHTTLTPRLFAQTVLAVAASEKVAMVPALIAAMIVHVPSPHLRHWLVAALPVWHAALGQSDTPASFARVLQLEGRPVAEGVVPPDATESVLPHAIVKAVLRALTPLSASQQTTVAEVFADLRQSPHTATWFIKVLCKAHSNALAEPQIERVLKAISSRPETGPHRHASENMPLGSKVRSGDRSDPLETPRLKIKAVSTASRVPPDQKGRALAAPYHAEHAEMSRMGGIVALINLFNHLGLPAADAGAGSDVSIQLLHHFVQRTGHDDCMSECLPAVGPDPDGWLLADKGCVFVPALASLSPSAPWVLRRIEGVRGRRALCWAHGDFCVALLDANALRSLRHSGENIVVGRQTLAVHIVPDALKNGLALLVQRTVRRHLQAPWRHVLMRPAYVIASLTHLDVTLDLDDVRLPERRAGLDISPGWVDWFGRVVTLHFERFDKPSRGDVP